jgi:peptidoglycan hydrolase-like protein with peptidoglycan-binding domain
MNQELVFETLPFEIDPEFQDEEFELDSEKGRRRPFGDSKKRSSRPRSRTGMQPKRSKRPPVPKPQVIPGKRRRPWEVIRSPYYVPLSEPFPAEPEPPHGSERVRWVQDCLNHAMRLQLPVTGLMNAETRSAVRSFQKQQGLRVSGIVGPDTEESIKAACAGQPAGKTGVDNSDEELELGPLSATLTWLKNPNNPIKPYLFTREQTANIVEGGIYIAVDTRRGNQILKVGKSRSFKLNPYDDQRYRNMERPGGRPGLRFYLATFTIPRGRSGGGVLEMIEDAVARLLYRAGIKLPEHSKTYTVQPVRDTVSIRNVLPPPLIHLLKRAYGHEGYRKTGADWKKQPIPARIAGTQAPTSLNTLYLTPRTYPNWEITGKAGETPKETFHQAEEEIMHYSNCNCPKCRMAGEQEWDELEFPNSGETDGQTGLESPFSEIEEIELAAELLSVSSEEELNQFLGKLVKRAWRGVKKVGKVVGRIAKPFTGVIRGVVKAALPVVGGALGSFIPIPGVGTAVGSALGGALSKALELEHGELEQDEQELEMARRLVRIAGTAARQAALADPNTNPHLAANNAVIAAARQHVPNLSTGFTGNRLTTSSSQGLARTGRWIRQGQSIVVLGA